jgi:hypothetical protein
MKTKSQLRHFGYWPDGAASTVNQPAELTVAARRIAASALEELSRLGVTVELDKAGKAHFTRRGFRRPRRGLRWSAKAT